MKMGTIADFVNSRAEARAEGRESHDEKKVTVRLLDSDVEELDFIAGKLGDTRSGLAAELLTRAIQEAGQVLAGHPVLLRDGVSPDIIAEIGDAEDRECQENKS
jgi:hypothetical protein